MSAAVALPSTQTAIIAGPTGDFQISSAVSVPTLQPDEIMIKTTTVALNPVDTKLVGDFVTPGCVFGFDCAGVVVAVGSAVTKDLKIGDRVCGSASGMNREKPLAGAFAEYVKFPGDMALKVPDFMSDEDAAALGTAVASACMTLFWSLGMPLSVLDGVQQNPAPTVLVYGGSTSTGTMVIQLLHLCGFHIITTCSPRNFELVKSYGADEVFDYKTPTCAADIRSHTRNALGYAIDCFAEDSSMKFCYAAIGRAGGRYTALNPFSDRLATRKVIKPDWILATRIAGDGSAWPAPYGCDPEPRLKELAGPLFAKVQKLLDQGKIRAHPIKVEEGGFESVVGGVGVIRRGEVSGVKLVYRV
ncbi:putative alcohol dehydrogenase [Pseudomassariella vexata]|uniref:Putative alcohol dehydrogenase n=1 Tax=Pseudomassariella vexata TaxID=1141098 RepID=A0A1Y2E789_9PEZI|nr:putative alcohol dehydrogenase [Pseudomassariella vexata]ORY67421.1 putative alcohol dehydrogenase [Pseudomassariella vexata]